MKLNQMGAAQAIINHVVKHQNNFTSSFLFMENFINLVEKGILVRGLLNSDIFSFKFDYEEWPLSHTLDEEYTRAYNGDIFTVRKAYRDVFPEEEFETID